MFLCPLSCCLFFWSAFDCVCFFFFPVCLLVAFRLALLSVVSVHLFLLPFPPILHSDGKYLMAHNEPSDIPSHHRSFREPKTVDCSPVQDPFPIGHGPSAHCRYSEIINWGKMPQLISHSLSVASLPCATLTFMSILCSRSNRCQSKYQGRNSYGYTTGNIRCAIITHLIFGDF